MGESKSNGGYIKLYRKALDDWKWKDLQHWRAWEWMMLNAAYKDNGELKRGQLKTTLRELSKISGMSRMKTSRFLKRCEIEKDISWSRAETNFRTSVRSVTNPVTKSVTNDVTNTSLITILGYSEYQASQLSSVTNPVTNPVTEGGTSYKKEEKNKKEKKKNKSPRSSDRAPSDHQRIFDHFVQERRKAIGIEDWNPTNGGQMGKNIKALLRQYDADRLIQMISNYFRDMRQSGKSWPWTLFFSDPIQWDRSGVQSGIEKWLERED